MWMKILVYYITKGRVSPAHFKTMLVYLIKNDMFVLTHDKIIIYEKNLNV